MLDPATKSETERWFLDRGVPHFIYRYSASRDVFTRAVPFFTLVFLLEVLVAANVDWGWIANAVALIGGFAVLTGIWALINSLRRRPALARPESVGPVEIGVFVVVPAILPLIFGGQWRQAIATAAGNLVLVGAVYTFTGFAFIPLTAWALREIVSQGRATFRMVTRGLPLLLVFTTFLLLTQEVWRVSAGVSRPFFIVLLAFFFGVGTVFLMARIPDETKALSAFGSWAEVVSKSRGTPVAHVAEEVSIPVRFDPSHLAPRERANAWLVVLFSEGLQILIVSVSIAIFFVVFALIAVPLSLQAEWSGVEPRVLIALDVWNQQVALTSELVKVAAFLTAFSGLYFTVYVLTDDTYRREFLAGVLDDIAVAFAVREVYLRAVASGE